MCHLKGTLGLTLFPDKALLEIIIRLFNSTPLPHSFHLWTNPAVHVNDQYQSVFPPDVQAVYDHGKRDVSAFPIACGMKVPSVALYYNDQNPDTIFNQGLALQRLGRLRRDNGLRPW